MRLFFDAYYTDALDISNPNVLVDIALRIGINHVEAYNMITSERYKQEVLNKDLYARSKRRVSGVPSFTITYRTSRKPFNFSGGGNLVAIQTSPRRAGYNHHGLSPVRLLVWTPSRLPSGNLVAIQTSPRRAGYWRRSWLP